MSTLRMILQLQHKETQMHASEGRANPEAQSAA